MIVANGLFVDMAGILCNTALNVKNTFVTLVNYNIVTIGRKLSALYLVDFRLFEGLSRICCNGIASGPKIVGTICFGYFFEFSDDIQKYLNYNHSNLF